MKQEEYSRDEEYYLEEIEETTRKTKKLVSIMIVITIIMFIMSAIGGAIVVSLQDTPDHEPTEENLQELRTLIKELEQYTY